MVLVKGSLPTTSTNDRSEKNDRKYKKKFLNQNISKNFNKDNGQPMVLVKGSLPTTSTNDRSEKNDRKYKKKFLNQNMSKNLNKDNGQPTDGTSKRLLVYN